MNIIEMDSVNRIYKVSIRDGNIMKYIFSRKYEIIKAVDNMSFSINEGELVGFVGANGAGKSTAIKLMCGILTPSEGIIKVLGNNLYEKMKKNMLQVGVIFGQRSQLWWDLPLIDTYKLLKKIYRIVDSVYDESIELLIKYLEIDMIWNKPVRMMSLGQRMKGEIGAAILHNPRLLFLDEPTIGLDVMVKKQVRDFIKVLNKERGLTIFLTSHDMRDIEEVCNRVILVNKGKIFDDASIEELIRKYGRKSRIDIEFVDCAANDFKISGLKTIYCEAERKKYSFVFDKGELSTGRLLSELSKYGEIVNFNVREDSIEDVICNLYTELKDIT